MKELKLSNNKSSIIDDDIYDYLSKFKWYYNKGYARRRARKSEGLNREKVMLHRFIINAKEGEIVDHINGNTLDNRVNNLRIVSNKENVWNSTYMRNTKSGVKGITWHKRDKVWMVRIQKNGIRYSLGNYGSLKEAKKIYLNKNKELYGEYAREVD